MLKINEIKAKSILTKTNLPASDYVINPYNGCQFGCTYCYAAQIARWRHPGETWGTFLDVKVNAPDLLKLELNKLYKRLKKKDYGVIFFSSVTDPYQAAEAKYKLTRRCLAELAEFGYEGEVSILTKSPLVTRDIDILKKLKHVSVGLTITTTDDQVARFLEPKAPNVSERIKALAKLHQAKIKTYAFVGPILPHFTNNKKTLKKLLDQLETAGVDEVWFEHINLNPRIKKGLYDYLETNNSQLVEKFEQARSQSYRDKLNKTIKELMKDRKMKMAMGEVIYHNKAKK